MSEIVRELRAMQPRSYGPEGLYRLIGKAADEIGRLQAWQRARLETDDLTQSELSSLRAQLASARKAVEETESYRLALAWIEGQSTDPKAREIATDALQCAETDDLRKGEKNASDS